MAVIGKIRERSTLLLVVIGVAMLAFILGDMLSSSSSFTNGPENLGEISGEVISGTEFEAAVQKQLALYQEREQTTEIPEGIMGQLREQVWNTMLEDQILGSQYKELGVVVGSKELGDLIYGANPHPQVIQGFTDPTTGQFDPANVIRFIKNLDQDETGKTKNQWLNFENAIKQQRIRNKYNTLISKGLFATNTETKIGYNENNRKYSIQYVAKQYNAVPDSTINVSDAEIKKYYNDNPQEFDQERMRTVNYVSFKIIPSAEDSAETKAWVDDIYTKFKTTKNDSLFVSVNSDKPYDRNLYSKNLLPAGIDTNIMLQTEVGYMEEPELLNDGTYKMVKIAKIKFAPDSVRARHILISYQNTPKDSALARADSIKKALEAGADFAALAAQLSQDPSNKADTGNLGWFRENMMLKAINDTCFAANVGEFKIVDSRIGAHVFQVIAKSPVVKKIQLAIIERKIESSRETFDSYFIQSNQFSVAIEEGKDMKELATKDGLKFSTAALRENDNQVNEINGSRSIVRWAYTAKEGDISEPFSFTDQFVITQLVDAKEDGIAPFEKVKEVAKLGAIRDKKAELFMAEMKGTDINAIAESIGKNVERANDLVFSAFSIPKIGFEPRLMGKIFSLKQGDLSFPIKGKNGVYVVLVENVTEPNEGADISANKTQIVQARQSRVTYEVFDALKDKAEVEDNRYLFY